MAAERRGVYSASVFTLATFLAPALLAPGPVELANLAGVVFALWMAADVWRRYGRRDLPETFPHRPSPVGPAVVASAALIFAVALLHAWTAGSGAAAGGLEGGLERAEALWAFPGSPVSLFLAPLDRAPEPNRYVATLVPFLTTAAVAVGALFGLLTLVAGVYEPETLRRHAMIWKGVRMEDAEQALARRGGKGLRPIRDPFVEAEKAPISGRLYTRAAALVVAVLALAYAPVAIRILAGMADGAKEPSFVVRLGENPFFALWLPALWAILLAASLIYLGAYLKLGAMLARR